MGPVCALSVLSWAGEELTFSQLLGWCAAGMAGARAAAISALAALASATSFEPLALNKFHEANLPRDATAYYRVWLSSVQSDVKVHLLPLSGDTDVVISFDPNATLGSKVGSSIRTTASWSLQGHGAEELLLRRDVFCKTHIARSSGAVPAACFLYLSVRGYYEEATSYRIGVIDAANAHSGGACHPGCSELLLSNRICDAECNVTSCAFDRGSCIAQFAAACAPGCDQSWLHDGECDDACFSAACAWDGGDCAAMDIEGCPNSCFADYIDDGECDRACNTPECLWDGNDCAHGHAECYERPLGDDYRGAVNVTVSGLTCQRWGSQFPQQHFFTHASHPASGLGAHSACRNPGAINPDGVWCYTTDHRVRWERCDIGAPVRDPGGCDEPASDSRTGGTHKPVHRSSTCERHCPRNHALITGAERVCGAADDCRCVGPACVTDTDEALPAAPTATSSASSTQGVATDPCAPERRVCGQKRLDRERLILILWVTLSSTSLFVMGLVVHAYRLTSPLGSPRSFAMAGYAGIDFAQPFTAATSGGNGRDTREHDFDEYAPSLSLGPSKLLYELDEPLSPRGEAALEGELDRREQELLEELENS